MAVRTLILILLAAPTAHASVALSDGSTIWSAHTCKGVRQQAVRARPPARPPELICARYADGQCVERRLQLHWRAE